MKRTETSDETDRLLRCARNDGYCARNDGYCARNDGSCARNDGVSLCSTIYRDFFMMQELEKTTVLGELSVQQNINDHQVIYTFDGNVDEHFNFQNFPYTFKPLVIFNLEKINQFNSVGIRSWIQMIKQFHGKCDLKFVKCSVTMIDQINMIPHTLGHGTIESFYAPYFCDKDKKESNRLINLNIDFQKLLKNQAPEFDCEKCGGTLSFDAIEESYFQFVQQGTEKAS